MKFGTKVIHAGVHPDPLTGAVMTPIYQTSTYAQDAVGKHKGYEYARTKNPTRSVLESNVAALENGVDAAAFSSGLAAMDAIVKLLRSGDEIIASNDLYGGSYRLLDKIFKNFGIVSHFVDMRDPRNVEDKINEKTRLIWVETPTNPVLSIVDIEAVASLSKGKEIILVVDNTFASPYLQNPIDLGADLVLHSATKYLGGHSDVVLGIVIASTKELGEKIHFIQNSSGAVPGPMDSFLVLRGIKTLHLRMERACANAMHLARFLENHPKIAKVNYPGLESHPGHELAKKQMRAFGGMISFDLKDNSIENAKKVMESLDYFTLAESLGGVESLVSHPSSMTHASIPKEERLRSGLTDSLIRLSVGVEDIEDLQKDISDSLEKI
jgi:cystathionine gamma-lyase